MWARKLDRRCEKWRQAMFGISSLETNKDHLLHRIQSVWTITNLKYYYPGLVIITDTLCIYLPLYSKWERQLIFRKSLKCRNGIFLSEVFPLFFFKLSSADASCNSKLSLITLEWVQIWAKVHFFNVHFLCK